MKLLNFKICLISSKSIGTYSFFYHIFSINRFYKYSTTGNREFPHCFLKIKKIEYKLINKEKEKLKEQTALMKEMFDEDINTVLPTLD